MGKQKFTLFFIITVLFLVINEPYAFRWILPLPELVISASIYLIFLLLMMFSVKRIRALPPIINIAYVITILAWLLYYVYYSDTSYITRIVLLVITYIFLVCINNDKDFYKFWKYNNRFILIQAFLATVCCYWGT